MLSVGVRVVVAGQDKRTDEPEGRHNTDFEETLEFALEYIGPDELVEVTPSSIRLRKRMLNPEERRKAKKSRA